MKGSLGWTLAAEHDQTKLWKSEMEEGGGRPRLKSLRKRKSLKRAAGSLEPIRRCKLGLCIEPEQQTYIMLLLVYGLARPGLQNLLKHIWVPKLKPLPHGEWIIRQEFICWIHLLNQLWQKSLHLSTWHTADQWQSLSYQSRIGNTCIRPSVSPSGLVSQPSGGYMGPPDWLATTERGTRP